MDPKTSGVVIALVVLIFIFAVSYWGVRATQINERGS
jgi:hypothetical protein